MRIIFLQLTAQNEVNIQALTERFVKSAGDAWKTLVETQVKTCWDELNSEKKYFVKWKLCNFFCSQR